MTRLWPLPAMLALLALALVLASPASRSSAAEGELTGALAYAGGFSLAVWGGGTADELLDAATAQGCITRSVFANRPGGGLVGYFPTALSAPNKPFLDIYPGGVLPELAVVVVCGPGGTPPPLAPAPGPPPTETPTPTPTPTATAVANTAPVVRILEIDTTESLIAVINFRYDDAEGDAVGVEIDWGDGQTGIAPGPAGMPYTQQHVYNDRGNYEVTVTATDEGGASGAVSTTAGVHKKVLASIQVDIRPVTNCDFSGANELYGTLSFFGETRNWAATLATGAPYSTIADFDTPFHIVGPTDEDWKGHLSVHALEADSGLAGADDDLGTYDSQEYTSSVNAETPRTPVVESAVSFGTGCTVMLRWIFLFAIEGAEPAS